MAASQRVRDEATFPDRLIRAAVRLYARHGLEGVSLRKICIEAGNGNNNAVQYHFGDSDGLIQAILRKHTPGLEFERAKRLAAIRGAGVPPVHELVDILHRPVIDMVDEEGERSFARFLLALTSTPAGTRHLAGVQDLLPISKQIIGMIEDALPGIPGDLLRERLRLSGLLVLMSVFNRLEPYDSDDRLDGPLVDHAIRMASDAVAGPLSPDLRSRLEEFHPHGA